ncbi:membrane dipeptidase [Solitalea lacus]|uniref:membrane dipeptidase n=1 Tax=Solitalea lacus TaxID=2911172 RepID=UPI001EDB01BB|nr:membrane dipeptidase [Solitalea lacus]UKJ09255.1 dipeptidase [Solitalea lacus]
MKTFYIDLHCHPGMRAYGKSFSTDTPGQNTTNKQQKHSIWHYDPPTFGDRLAQRTLGLTKFSQSNFTALSYGSARCICASLYSVERGFVRLTIGTGLAADFLANLISGLGPARIQFLQANNDYFSDLVGEYNYYLQLHDKEISFSDIRRKYVMVKSFIDLQEAMQINENNIGVETIYVIVTIEGLHDLNAGNGNPPDEVKILENLDKLKNWEYKPFFVTFAHHFYNDLCGHAESLSDFFQDLMTNQEPGMNTGFTELGWKVLKKLIDNTDGKRILVDIKHMSYLARKEYINFLKTEHAADYAMKKFPLIASHGACNGKQSGENPNPTPGLELTASRMFDGDINFYDEEILEIAKSGGVIGLQLDERRIASKRFKNSLRLEFASASKRKHSNSKMVWNNIQHIVQLLDKNDLFAWDCIAIGSDFDGIIDPINMFWTEEEMDDLVQYTERHAFNFFNDPNTVLKNNYNRIEPAEVVQRIFQYNAFEFFRKYF